MKHKFNFSDITCVPSNCCSDLIEKCNLVPNIYFPQNIDNCDLQLPLACAIVDSVKVTLPAYICENDGLKLSRKIIIPYENYTGWFFPKGSMIQLINIIANSCTTATLGFVAKDSYLTDIYKICEFSNNIYQETNVYTLEYIKTRTDVNNYTTILRSEDLILPLNNGSLIVEFDEPHCSIDKIFLEDHAKASFFLRYIKKNQLNLVKPRNKTNIEINHDNSNGSRNIKQKYFMIIFVLILTLDNFFSLL